jgi:hypothetical protein
VSDLSPRLSAQELELEGGQLLPNKEVLSILDLLVNVDLALDLAAPIDLAVAANLNVAAPVDASASANVLAIGSESQALADQGTMIDQYISGDAIAEAPQDATVDQSNDVIDDGSGTVGEQAGEQLAPAPGTGDGSAPTSGDSGTGGADGVNAQALELPTADSDLLSGPLLNVDVDIALDADMAAPVAGAVAANANAAVPIDAAVSANIGTIDSQSVAVAEQDAIINQKLDGVTAHAIADQQADITQ